MPESQIRCDVKAVMAGLVPAIHVDEARSRNWYRLNKDLHKSSFRAGVDGRHKTGHDATLSA